MPIFSGVRARRGYSKMSHHDFWLVLLGPTSNRKIKQCYVRYVSVDANGIPTAEWTETATANFQGPTTIKNLQPGTRYAFEIRALGALGKTDWSDSAIKICT